MKAPIAPSKVPLERRSVTEIAFDCLERCSGQPSQIRSTSQQSSNSVPARGQLMHEVRSDETGGACDEAVHGVHDPATPSLFNPIFGPGFELTATLKSEKRMMKTDIMQICTVWRSSLESFSPMAIPILDGCNT